MTTSIPRVGKIHVKPKKGLGPVGRLRLAEKLRTEASLLREVRPA